MLFLRQEPWRGAQAHCRPRRYICDNCINVCKGILDKELNADARRQTTSLRGPKSAEIRRQLDNIFVGQEAAKNVLAIAVHNPLQADLEANRDVLEQILR